MERNQVLVTSVELVVMTVMKQTIRERKMFLFPSKSLLFLIWSLLEMSPFQPNQVLVLLIAVTDYMHSPPFMIPEKHLSRVDSVPQRTKMNKSLQQNLRLSQKKKNPQT